MLTLDMGRPTQANGIYLDPITGRVALLHEMNVVTPISAAVEQSYPRTNKSPKVLNSLPADPLTLNVNPNRSLEQFDEIYAIDTNTKTLRSRTVSITGVVGADSPKVAPGQTIVTYRPILCMEFHEVEGKPENMAWMEVILAIRRSEKYSNRKKYALVVDSDLGAIPRYNSRESPFYADFFLPKEFVLVYASADSGSENVANKMLRLSDTMSNGIFARLEAEWTEDGLHDAQGQPYKLARVWIPPAT